MKDADTVAKDDAKVKADALVETFLEANHEGWAALKWRVAELVRNERAAALRDAAERQEPVKVKTAGERLAEKMVMVDASFVRCVHPYVSRHVLVRDAFEPVGVASAKVLVKFLREYVAEAIDTTSASAAREAAEQMREACWRAVVYAEDWDGTPAAGRSQFAAAIRALPLPAATTTEGRD